MTMSDRALDRKIAEVRNNLRRCEVLFPDGFRLEALREKLDWLLQQRALPRNQRQPFERGSI